MHADSSPTIKLTIGNRDRCRFFTFPVRLTLEIVAILLIFIPLFLFAFNWPRIESKIHAKVLEKTRLAPKSDGNESWMNPPATTRRAYRLFNVTNYMEVMTSNKNPTMKIKETEPFVYKLAVRKNNVHWFDNDTKIKYSVERIFTRDQEFSEKLLEQEGAFVDIPRALFRTQFGRIVSEPFFILAENNAFNYSRAVDKIEGFVSPIFAVISARMQGPNCEKYGLIYRYNGTNGFNLTIHTGIDNSSIKGQMIDFQSEYTPFKTDASKWNFDIFDGLTFPPSGEPPNRRFINVFQADVCHPVQLRYKRTVEKFGFKKVHEYVLKLINATECPSMDENCIESDRLDISKCFSASIPSETLFLTKPHVFGHNSSSMNVEFEPDEEKHESSIYFEPMTGTPVSARLRIQMNIRTQIDRIKVLSNGETEPMKMRATERFVPVVWIDQSITLNEEVVDRLRRVSRILHYGQKLHESLRLTYIFVGLVLIIGLFVLAEFYLRNLENKDRAENEKVLDDQENQPLSIDDGLKN